MPLIIVAGPSGAGKSTLIQALVAAGQMSACQIDVHRAAGSRSGPGKTLVAKTSFLAAEQAGEYAAVYRWSGSMYGVRHDALARSSGPERVALEYPGDYPECAEFRTIPWFGLLVLPPSARELERRLVAAGRADRIPESIQEYLACKALVARGLPDRWRLMRSGTEPQDLVSRTTIWLSTLPFPPMTDPRDFPPS